MLYDLELGISNFQVEYNALPAPQAELHGDTFTTESSGPLLACLLGQNVLGNVKQIAFIEPRLPINGKGGLVSTTNGDYYLDTWGRPLQVVMDLTHHNQIANPDLKNSDPLMRSEAPAKLFASVIVFSAGPDGAFFTSDDFTSWRPDPVLQSASSEKMLRPDLIIAGIVLFLIAYSFIGLLVTRAKQAAYHEPAKRASE